MWCVRGKKIAEIKKKSLNYNRRKEKSLRTGHLSRNGKEVFLELSGGRVQPAEGECV